MAQSFSFASNQVDIVAAPGFNHFPLGVQVTSLDPGFSLTNVQLSSDAPWVTPAADAPSGTVVLRFVTSNLVNQTYTATITARTATHTNSIFVRALVSPLNITRLVDDPRRSRMYGIHQNGVQLGAVVAFDPVTGERLGAVTVGKRPGDLDFSKDGREMLVINSASKTISVIDLATMALKETIPLGAYNEWGVESTWADIAVGAGNIIYYSDGSWGPILHVMERSTRRVLQSILAQGDSGFGDFAITPDGKKLIAWTQYGWSAGSAASCLVSYSILADGTLSFIENTENRWDSVIGRDPLDSPIYITTDGQTVFAKGLAVSAASITGNRMLLPGFMRAITPTGEIMTTDTAIYDTRTSSKVADLPKSLNVQAISSDYARLVYFDSAVRELKTLNLLAVVGAGLLNRKVLPADDSITLSPTKLQWSIFPGVDRYRVYLGTSETEVNSAQTNSPLYRGEVTGTFYALSSQLAAGAEYYWRVDPVTEFDVAKGEVFHFTVSTISSSTNSLSLATVSGHRNLRATFDVGAAEATAWEVSADQPWVRFTATNGTTPATIEMFLDSRNLPTNVHNATVSLRTGGQVVFTLPIVLRVEPLNLTVMRSDPQSVFAYAISESTGSGLNKAYLLEINTLTEEINRVAPAGYGVTDLAVHHGDNRIYVANWNPGLLLALDLDTFALARTYVFSPAAPTGYGASDVYRISAGAPGRLVVEEEDQWIEISLFDTVTGTNLSSFHLREGGGGFGPTGRYYYHGENNSSGAALLKFDVTGDVFTQLASARVERASYYGSRTVVVSEQGNRIFWNGGVFDADLHVEWDLGQFIYAASADGRLAFGDTTCFDVVERSTLTNRFPSGSVKAFNSLTAKLVYQNTNTLGFQKFGLEEVVVPSEGAILSSAPQLQSPTVPMTSMYRIFLGQSLAEVSAARTNSPAYLGAFATAVFNLPGSLSPGTYYWRMDAITLYGVIPGAVHSFTISPVVPDQSSLQAFTFTGRPAVVSLALAASNSTAWTAMADAPWISLSQTNGNGSATLQVTLMPIPSTNLYQYGSITVSGASGVLFTVPVRLAVEPLQLTFIKSMPDTAKAFAISQVTPEGRAYLIEIDTQTETIQRVVPAGDAVSDLALHHADRRIYIPNWRSGVLRAFDMDTLQQVREYDLSLYDVYRVAAGGRGRLVFEGRDQWVNMYILNTDTGVVLAQKWMREGGGVFDPTGRFYYHVDNNISDASIRKYNVVGDTFTDINSARVGGISYYGSRTVVASDDGRRLFWNGSAFDPYLLEEWTIRDEIFATSTNGAIALSRSTIYDVPNQKAILGMPSDTPVSAFNSATRKVLLQQGSKLGFFALPNLPITLAAPVLSTGSVSSGWVTLAWEDHTLETGFTIQRRVAGTNEWTDSGTASRNATNFTISGLTQKTAYEFRVKADSPSGSSDWSDILQVATPGTVPGTPGLTANAYSGSVFLYINPSSEAASIILERAVASSTNWVVLATLNTNVLYYEDLDVITFTNYSYRAKARNPYGDSYYSPVRTVWIPAPAPPDSPAMQPVGPFSPDGILISWGNVTSETGYRLERRMESPTNWTQIATLSTNQISFLDTNMVPGTEYFYRVQAFNGTGSSPWSTVVSAIGRRLERLLEDDFDPAMAPLVWSAIEGGVATNGIQGFPTTNALYFSGPGRRAATTVPIPMLSEGYASFRLRSGNEAVDGPLWNDSETGEAITMEYSLDGDVWTHMTTLSISKQWLSISVAIHASAISPHTYFRWRQQRHSGEGFDTWAIDDVAIYGTAPERPAPPAFILASATSPTSVAVIWSDGLRAASYLVQRSTEGQTWTNMGEFPSSQTWFMDETALPASEYFYRVQARNFSGASAWSPPAHAATLSQQGFWLNENAGVTGSNQEKTLLAKDSQGVAYILKYAFNLNADEGAQVLAPGTGSSGAPAIWVDAARDRLCVEYVRRKVALNPGIAYAVQFSDSTGLWNTSSSANEVSVVSIDAIWERVRVEDAIPCSNKASRFARVTVTLTQD